VGIMKLMDTGSAGSYFGFKDRKRQMWRALRRNSPSRQLWVTRVVSDSTVTFRKEFTITEQTSSRLRTGTVAEQLHDKETISHGIVFGRIATCAQLKELCLWFAAAPRSPSPRPPD
jgi:hypothetical protein